jgi:hypothetical protein
VLTGGASPREVTEGEERTPDPEAGAEAEAAGVGK